MKNRAAALVIAGTWLTVSVNAWTALEVCRFVR